MIFLGYNIILVMILFINSIYNKRQSQEKVTA